MEKRWKGGWEFNNSMHPKYGRSGTTEVNAPDERSAKEAIREQASRLLTGSTMMSSYVEVSNITQC